MRSGQPVYAVTKGAIYIYIYIEVSVLFGINTRVLDPSGSHCLEGIERSIDGYISKVRQWWFTV